MTITHRRVLIGAGAGLIAAGDGGAVYSSMQDRRPAPGDVQQVTSLPADDKTCGWYNLIPKRTPRTVLTGDASAPFVVVSAGFTGLAAARQLALNFADKQIILVEAQEVGVGTSGRNAGFAIDLPHDISTPD